MENSEDGSDLLLGAPARDACAGDTQGRAHASERPPPTPEHAEAAAATSLPL